MESTYYLNFDVFKPAADGNELLIGVGEVGAYVIDMCVSQDVLGLTCKHFTKHNISYLREYESPERYIYSRNNLSFLNQKHYVNLPSSGSERELLNATKGFHDIIYVVFDANNNVDRNQVSKIFRGNRQKRCLILAIALRNEEGLSSEEVQEIYNERVTYVDIPVTLDFLFLDGVYRAFEVVRSIQHSLRRPEMLHMFSYCDLYLVLKESTYFRVITHNTEDGVWGWGKIKDEIEVLFENISYSDRNLLDKCLSLSFANPDKELELMANMFSVIESCLPAGSDMACSWKWMHYFPSSSFYDDELLHFDQSVILIGSTHINALSWMT